MALTASSIDMMVVFYVFAAVRDRRDDSGSLFSYYYRSGEMMFGSPSQRGKKGHFIEFY